MKKAAILGVFALALFFAPELMAQPGLPDAPNQAPIGSGLAFLAAAGGAYAWRKLRNKD